jgi:uncharacterized repeat protein (TIGR02543 family)
VKNAGTEEAGTVIRVTPPPNRVAAEKFPADPEWDGHVFEGWYAAGGEFTASTPVTGDMTVYARWTGGGSAPLDACDLLLYYFEDPACVGVPDPGDPLKITITYPAGTSVPADENKIKIIHNGASVKAEGGWNAGVRAYTVTAKNGTTKTYVVTAVIGEESPVPPEDACEMLLYYFTKPDGELLSNGKLVLENKSGSEEDPFFIDIGYPYGTAIPTDGNIVFLATGAVTNGGWLPQGGGYVRDYTVTAASGTAAKHYRVRAMMEDAPVLPSDDRDILLYYFTDPVSIGIVGGGSGNSKFDPVEIAINYPENSGIPTDAGITVIHNDGSEVTASDGWPDGTRLYTVTAESKAKKYYRVTATAVTSEAQPPVSDSETCDILLYYFTDPVSIGTFGSGSGNSAGDPVKITIPYPDGTSVPADSTNKIQIIHNGGSVAPSGGWSAGVRKYVVTAKNGTTKKFYEVTAQQETDIIHVTGVTLSQTSLARAPLQTASLTATVYPEGAANLAVTWTSSNPGAATVTQQGEVKAVAAGNAVIFVTTKDGGYAAMCAVTVEDPVTGITLSETSLVLVPGQNAYLDATVNPSGANQAVTWSITDSGVATVDQNGKVTGLAEGGPITVTATSVADPGKTATCAVTVAPPSDPPPGGTGAILVYRFTNPGREGTIGSGIGSGMTDAIPIIIHYPPSGSIPADDGIFILNTGTLASLSEWMPSSEGSDRYYSVTGDTTKYYKVTAKPVFDIYTEDDWSDAISYINGQTGTADSLKVFKLNIIGDISVGGKTSGSTVTGAYKEIRLTGTGKLECSGGSLIRTAANQTFIIDGPTLIGGGGAPLVYIVANSSVKLQSGSIEGNTYSGSGGGVYVLGSFTMTGGTVRGNSATYGGGVLVANGGSFMMSGGTISGNSASSGGGVHVYSVSGYVGGSFTMNGGTISGNAAIQGGGVYVGYYSSGASNNGRFTMNKGTIYGSSADELLANSASSTSNGAAVWSSSNNSYSNVKTSEITVTKP